MAYDLNQRYDYLNFFIVGPTYESQKGYERKLHAISNELEIANLHFYGPSDDVRKVLKELLKKLISEQKKK